MMHAPFIITHNAFNVLAKKIHPLERGTKGTKEQDGTKGRDVK
jgi:hypothetical protein